MKVALVCPTVGQTRRGYERFLGDLFALLEQDVDLTLFKGGGEPSVAQEVVPHVRRTGLLSRIFGARLRFPRYHLEFATFACALAPRLAGTRFDLVHFIDPPLGRWLNLARRVTGGRFALLFTNAGPSSYDGSRWVDHVHCLTPSAYDEARSEGLDSDEVTMVPVGTAPEQFATCEDRASLRRRFGIPDETFVVLSVTTLNREHKRVDYLIEEMAASSGDSLLWVDGSLHPDGDPSLIQLGKDRLGERFRHTHVPSDKVGELFALADVLVSTSLTESFGMAIVEAMTAGLPVVVHDSAHFRWLVGDGGHLVDMRVEGALAERLAYLEHHPAERNRPEADSASRRFRWTELKQDYLDMYRRACAARSVDKCELVETPQSKYAYPSLPAGQRRRLPK